MKKRVLALITALCLIFGMVPAAFAEEPEAPAPDSGTCGEHLTWALDDTGTLTVSGTGPMTDYSHTSTADIPWYPNMSEITAVVVEEGVTTIGQAAFYSCSYLSELTLPSTLTSIGRNAFSYCSITELDLPDGLLTLGGFNGNPITELVIPDSVTSINDNAFTDCTGLTSVVLPASLETCGQMVFSGCSQLRQVVMPEMPNLRYFNNNVFSGCAIKDLSWYTHSEISYQMFSSNAFEELVIPDCVTTVADFAFENCAFMTKVTVPASVTSLGNVAFGSCTALESVYFLGDAPALGVDLFQRLTDITCYYPADNETWTADARNTYDGIVTWVAYDPETGEVDPDQPEDPTEPQPGYIHSGVYNGNINWSFNENSGLLSLSGAGEMPEPEDIFYPWDDYRDLYSHVDIGEDMTHIGVRCFASSSRLNEITVPGNVKFIGTAAFSYSAVRNVVIEEGVESIGDSAFYESSVRTVQLPSTISQMELVSTFAGCEDLTSVVIPNGVNVQTELGSLCETFKGCSSLKEVTLPDSLWSISVSTFEGCNQLTSIELPEGLKIIGDYAFADTASLTELVIPSTVTIIGDEAFGSIDWYDGEEFHNGITTIYFTGDAPSFSEYSFAGYQGEDLVTCYYPAGNATWNEEVRQSYGGNVNWLAYGDVEPEPSEPQPSEPSEPSEPGNTPDDSGTWGDNIVWELDGTTLYISGEGEMAHEDYSRNNYPWKSYQDTVTEVIITGEITTIATGAFREFRQLITVQLPDTITMIHQEAFSDCGQLEYINVPANLACLIYKCFFNCAKLAEFPLPEGLTEIGGHVFEGTALTHVVIPEGVTTIVSGTFKNCTALESILIPDSVTFIGDNVFAGCTSLTYVDLPDELMELGSGAFEGSGLIHVEIPDSIIFLQDRTFRDCTALNAVTFPRMLETIGSEAFYRCSSLTVVEIPDTVVAVYSRAFASCENLYAILIPDSVTSIHNTALDNCPGLRVHCYNLSYAHLYALANEIPVEILNDVPGTPVYDIFIHCGPGGSVVSEPNPSPAYRYVLVEVRPDSGYVLESLWYEVAVNPDLEVNFEQITDTIVAFFMPASDLYLDAYFVSERSPFTDVKESDYFYDPVRWAVSRGITTGMGNGKFAPNDSCTRAQVVTFLWRAAGEPEPISTNNPFRDVKASDYFYKAVLWAVENGITTGMSATSFGPNSPCTRGQVVTFLYRAAGGTGSYYGHNPFHDVKESDYYYDAVLWAVENGITTGMSATSFGPNSTCTRGQVVTFLFRFLY